jgi:hypothetical protein
LTIKKGSESPHIEVRDTSGNRIDPKTGNKVKRKSQENHTKIEYDI